MTQNAKTQMIFLQHSKKREMISGSRPNWEVIRIGKPTPEE